MEESQILEYGVQLLKAEKHGELSPPDVDILTFFKPSLLLKKNIF